MGCTVVVGGQYGSEGKGKVAALESERLRAPMVVRCGGPNSGHTLTVGGRRVVLRQIPAGIRHPNSVLLLAAGCAVDEEVLIREVDALGLPRERVVVDARCVLITEADRLQEKDLVGRIGSTGSGTGAALVRRMLRGLPVRLAETSELLRSRVRVETVAPLLHAHMDHGGDVVVEGTQGFGLSLLHGGHFPHVTSRDTTAAAFASEVGLSPRQVDRVVMVIRTWPIRVGGASGPLESEITWEQVMRESGAPALEEEYTSVSKRLRRVARFDMDAVVAACHYNRPTGVAVMGLDRLDYRNRGILLRADLTQDANRFLDSIEAGTDVEVEWAGTGFETEECIAVRSRS